ncbi:MAG: TlpA family protein disulfide reductase [Candidatus Rokuibacteriota bacterium]
MGPRRELVVAAALALGLLVPVGVPGASVTRDPFDAMVIDRPAEALPAPDVAFRTLDGREVRVGDLRGKLVLLGFFTTW